MKERRVKEAEEDEAIDDDGADKLKKSVKLGHNQ